MVDLKKLCELFHIEVADGATEDEMVALLVEVVEKLIERTEKAEGELAAARSSTLTAEMVSLKGTVARLEQVVAALPGAETELQARCRKVYGRG